MPRTVTLLAASLALGTAVALAGCAPAYTHSGVVNGKVQVVASTDVYGSIVAAIGGDRVAVTSLVSGGTAPSQYELTTQDRTSVRDANLVVYNGGGYDAFLYAALTLTGVDKIDAAVVSGHLDANGNGDGGTDTVPAGFNPNVFYDLAGMDRVATRIAAELSSLDPGGKTEYAANLASFGTAVDALVARETALQSSGDCGEVLLTSPLPGYLLQAAGCTDSASTAPGPATRLVAVDLQDQSAATQSAIAAASAAGTPVVDFAETLPTGDDYLSWMSGNLDALQTALAKPAS